MNHVKTMRLDFGWSQGMLAEKVKTSPEQIQRVELGQAIKIDLAVAICAALGKSLNDVFPGAIKALQALGVEMESANQGSEEAYANLRKIGIEADIRRIL